MVTNWLWLLTVAGGAFVLGAVMAYVLLRQRPLPPGEKSAQAKKIDRLYHADGTRRE